MSKKLYHVEIPTSARGRVSSKSVSFFGTHQECLESHYGYDYVVPVSKRVAKRLLEELGVDTPRIYEHNGHWYVRIEFVPYEEYGI